jgi:hypothetical protein
MEGDGGAVGFALYTYIKLLNERDSQATEYTIYVRIYTYGYITSRKLQCLAFRMCVDTSSITKALERE